MADLHCQGCQNLHLCQICREFVGVASLQIACDSDEDGEELVVTQTIKLAAQRQPISIEYRVQIDEINNRIIYLGQFPISIPIQNPEDLLEKIARITDLSSTTHQLYGWTFSVHFDPDHLSDTVPIFFSRSDTFRPDHCVRDFRGAVLDLDGAIKNFVDKILGGK
jgi:hypothetical protein